MTLNEEQRRELVTILRRLARIGHQKEPCLVDALPSVAGGFARMSCVCNLRFHNQLIDDGLRLLGEDVSNGVNKR